ncbi:uncharacterized protein METZ01_LOCUS395433 [marine metagenome]|uniref:NTP pyrophosphohydrolase MazG-like domain-containing protein n=1 Tax=marine metagenome TaxID=408172 RepID=A0A382V7W5_9ZZZZ
MNLNEYQKRAKKTAIYPVEQAFPYLATGLAAEAGEVAGLISKGIRGDHMGMVDHNDLVKEIGDVLWFVSQLATQMDIDLSEVAEINLAKLEDRQKRGKLKGSGDNR